MKRIEKQDQPSHKLAIRTLSWITQGQRLLSVAEIQQALAIELGDSDLDPDSTVDCDDIISACGGLVTRGHDSHDEILRLVHYTTKEYFERTKTMHFPNAQEYLASSCLTYLLFDVFSGALCPPRQDDVRYIGSENGAGNEKKEFFCFGCKRCWTAEQHEVERDGLYGRWKLGSCDRDPCSYFRREYYPFYIYAVLYWGHHAENCDDEAIEILTKTFLDDYKRVSGALNFVREGYGSYRPFRLRLQDSNPGSAMQLAAFLGLSKLMSKLLEDGFEPDVKDWSGKTTLFWAANKGHEDVVKILVAREDVDPNVRGQTTLLVGAVRNGYIAIVRLLLANEHTNINAKDVDTGWSALFHAIYAQRDYGRLRKGLQILKLLLACNNIKVNVKDVQGRTPLTIAVLFESVEGLQLLLRRGDLQLNERDDKGRTALHSAARQVRIEGIRHLLTRGDTQLNGRDFLGETALLVAAKQRRTQAMPLLLAHGDIDVNVKDGQGQTALHVAAKEGPTEAIWLLLEHGDIQINVMDERGRTALQIAAQHQIFKAVQLILAHKNLNVNATDHNGESALFSAVRTAFFNPGVAELFLAREDVDVNIRDIDGYAPLYHAVRSGQPGVVQLLLTREDLDINMEDGEGERLVSLAEDEHERDKAIEGRKSDAYNAIINLLRSYFLQRTSSTTSANITQQIPQRLAHTDDDDDDDDTAHGTDNVQVIEE